MQPIELIELSCTVLPKKIVIISQISSISVQFNSGSQGQRVASTLRLVRRPLGSPVPQARWEIALSIASTSASHAAGTASDGIRQSPRGDRATEPTFGPSGMADRLNCWLKKRL